MAEKFSLRGLAATLLPDHYAARYLENLAAGLNPLLLPGESKTRVLEQFHIPLRFREMAATGRVLPVAESTRAIDIWDVLFRSPRLAIISEAGAGKTTTLKYAAVVLAQQKMPESYIRRLTFLHQGQAFDHLLPIYADLGRFDMQVGDLALFLAKSFADYGFPRAKDFLRARLKEGRCLLLLDNFALLTAECRAHLKELLAAYPKVQVVIATRTIHLVNTLPDFACFEPLPFSESEIATFIDRRLGKDSPAAAGLLQALERSNGLRSMAGNPLLLSTLAWASENHPSLPLRLRDLYEPCLQVLLAEGAGMVPASVQSKLDRETRDKALRELGRFFHERHQERFSEEELQAAVQEVVKLLGNLAEEHSLSLLIKSGGLLQQTREQYAFLRLALQEYLTAQMVAAADRFTELLNRYVDDPWWHEVIVLATALLGNVVDVVHQIRTASNKPDEALFLAARCAAETPAIGYDTKKSLRDELLKVLQTDDGAPWHTAAVCIAALEGQKVSDYFTQALKEGPVNDREQAALVMGRIGSPEWATIPLLGALDKSRPWPVRSRAAWALGQLKDRRAIPALVETLKDEEEEVASAAASALSAIGEPAVPSLISTLRNEQPRMRQMAVKALGKMGTLAVRPLLNIIQDEKQPDNVIRGTAEALGLLREAEAIPHLINLLHVRGGRLAESAVAALAAIGEPAVQPLIDSLPAQSSALELRKAIVSALVAIGEPSIEPLVKSLDSHSASIRGAAEEALTHIGAPAIEALVAALRTEKWDLRRRIAQILGRIGDERLGEPLLLALSDEDPGVRARAAQILGQIGYRQATEQLINAMQTDPDEFVRRAAIKALADLKSKQAIGPLIEILGNSPLRDIGIVALGEIGEAAVEPLILAVNQSQNPEVQQVYVKVLSTIGMRTRIEEPTLAAVAKAYSLLFTGIPSLDEIIALLEHIRWWKQGEELHKAFSSARILAQARSLRDVAQYPEELAWVGTLESPFCLGIKKVLWDLNSVAQNIRLYLNDPRREGQRDALLSAIDTMTETREIINTQLLEFEKKPFAEIVESWHQMTAEAIKNLRGRAQLEIKLLTDDLALDSAASAGKVVFGLTNVGDSAARNLTVTLKPSGKDGFEVIGAMTQHLEPLGSGMQRNVEFLIKPLGVTGVSVAFEVSYDDDEGTDHRYPFSGRVRFFAIGEEYRPIPGSPYVPGPPVKTAQMFYGRQDVFDWIRENISGTYQQNILVLHGERRMGKTSILYQLYNRPPTPQHICVFFSLELPPPRSLGGLFHSLARKIHSEMIKSDLHLPDPVKEDFGDDAQRSFLSFCESVESKLGDRRLLIMVDEIDMLIDKVQKGVLSEDIFSLIRGLIQHSDKIAFIFTGAYKLREMLKDNRSILFNITMPYKISYLKQNEAEALIVEPVAEYLIYDDLVIDKILRVSACHPYFIQCICDSLVKLAQRKQKNFVALPDLDVVLHDVVQDNTGNLHKAVYAPLSASEQKALAALANVTDDYRIYVPPDVVAQELDRYKLGIAKPDLLDALRALRERDLVVEQRVGQSLQYGFQMGLIRMWLLQNEVLLRLSQEMKI